MKKDKLYILIFIFSIASLIISIVLKYNGVEWFRIDIDYSVPFPFIINTFMLIIQYYLIVGCIIRLNPKELFIKLLPYMPLNLIVYTLSEQYYFVVCLLLMFVTCISIKPKFTTIISFIINLIIIFAMQILLIWLKLDLKGMVFTGAFNIILVNIDQFILLSSLYYFNRKWGVKYAKLVFYRRKR